MALGLLLLIDLGVRATDLGAMYTDGGMFSRTEICYRVMTPWNWSFHFGGGSAAYQGMLFALAGLLAVALVVGYETRLATVGCWLMLLSLHHRVPPILSGADVLFRMLLFWGMFLPLGRVASVDRWRLGRTSSTQDEPVFSIASVAVLLQMPVMYLCSAIFKTNPAWLSGDVLAGALTHDFYVSRIGTYLLQFPNLLRYLTWATLALEWVGPIVVFSPWKTTAWRCFFVGGFAALHLGIIVCLEVDLFSFVAFTGLILFLPSEFWRSCRGWFSRFSPTAREGATPQARRAVDGRRSSGVWAGWIAGVALVYVAVVNIAGLPSRPLGSWAPDRWRFLATGLGLGQKWNMFEVVPSKPGWYVAAARLNDGSEIDLLREGAPVDWVRPTFPAGIYPNFRWRKIFREMAYEDELGYHAFREPIARYLCRDWNRRNGPDRQVVKLDLVYCMSRLANWGTGNGAQITIRDRLVRLEVPRLEEDRTTRTRL